jgi:ABC-type transport system substrate-binding protein
VRFTLKTNAGSVRVQMANFVRDDLARVGIECRVAAVDYNTLIVNMREDFDYDAILAGLGAAVPPDPAMCGNFYRSSGATHFWNVRQARPETAAEARVDSLFDRLLLPGTLAARRGLSSRIDRILNEECWLIWLPVMKVELPVRERFGNIAPTLLPHRVLWNSDVLFVKPRSRRPGR